MGAVVAGFKGVPISQWLEVLHGLLADGEHKYRLARNRRPSPLEAALSRHNLGLVVGEVGRRIIRRGESAPDR